MQTLMEDRPTKEDIPFPTRVELLANELKRALDEVAELRQNDRKKLAARHHCHLIEAYLKNCRFYLREVQGAIDS